MITSDYLGMPNTTKGSGSRGLNDTIVDTGLRKGQQMWKLRLQTAPGQGGNPTLSAGDVLGVDIAGVSITTAFTTDVATTLETFASDIAAANNVVSAVAKGFNIEVKITETKEVLFANPIVTPSSGFVVSTLDLEETQELSIVPGIVVVNSEDFEALRVDAISSTDSILGYAEIGTSETDTVWRLKRITKVGNITSIKYPELDGAASRTFNFSWDLRTSYTYS